MKWLPAGDRNPLLPAKWSKLHVNVTPRASPTSNDSSRPLSDSSRPARAIEEDNTRNTSSRLLCRPSSYLLSHISSHNTVPTWYPGSFSGPASVRTAPALTTPPLRTICSSKLTPPGFPRSRHPCLATRHRDAPALPPAIPVGVPSLRRRGRQLRVLAGGRRPATDGSPGGAEEEHPGEEGAEGGEGHRYRHRRQRVADVRIEFLRLGGTVCGLRRFIGVHTFCREGWGLRETAPGKKNGQRTIQTTGLVSYVLLARLLQRGTEVSMRTSNWPEHHF